MSNTNLLTYGERLGWERIEGGAAELLNFIQTAKENTKFVARHEGRPKEKPPELCLKLSP